MRMQVRLCLTVAAACALALVAAGPVAAQGEECSVSVEPGRGRTGTKFVISGSGFEPAELILQKAGAEPVTVPIEPPAAAPFEIPVQSGPGDEGRWTAIVRDAGATCSASVQFQVTLLDTAAALGAHAEQIPDRVPVGVYLAALLFGLVSGLVIARVRRASRA